MLQEMKVKDLLDILKIINPSTNNANTTHWEIGKCYFIRTVTMHLTGKLKYIDNQELVLEKAAWIADSGRFYDALNTGNLNEVEPFLNDVMVNRNCIVDATLWSHALPMEQK